MNKELDVITYMMASEKVINLVFVLEQTLMFMQEYSIEPDEEVKKALMPLLDKMKKWVNDERQTT